MSKYLNLTIALLLAATLLSCSAGEKSETARLTELASFGEKASYAIGLDVAGSLQRIQSDLDLKALLQGIEDGLSGEERLLSADEASQVMQQFSQQVQSQQDQERQQVGAQNLAEGKDFLQKNSDEEGVITTESGLQYLVLKEGTGRSPTEADKVRVQYRGTFLDGTEFDSSYKRGEPAVMAVSGLIPGFSEALQLMKVGGQSRFFIPPELAYRDKGAGDLIGPNATLIFEVELLGIEE